MIKSEIIKTEVEFHNLHRLWNKGHHYSIFSDWEWMFNYWKHLKKANDELAIFLFWISDNQWIIFPLKTNTKDLNKKLEFICSSKTDYNYPIEHVDKLPENDLISVYKNIFEFILSKYNAIYLKNLPSDTILAKKLLSKTFPNFKIEVAKEEICPFVKLEDFSFQSIDKDFYADITNSLRKIGKIEYHQITAKKDFLMALNIFFELNKKWWLDKGYPGLIKNRNEHLFFLNSLPTLYDKNKMHCSMIIKQKNIISVSVNFCANSTIYQYSSGHSLEYKKYGIGKIHLYHLFNNAIRNNFKYIDFMRGEESYKYKWLAINKFNYEISIKR